MKKLLPLLSALCLLLLTASQALAQTAPTGPPKYLYVERELLKPGAFGPHEREGNNFARMLTHAKAVSGEARYYRIALTPVAGNSNEVMYVFPFASLDDIAKYQMDTERWITRPGEMNSFFNKVNAERPQPQPGVNDDFHASQTGMIAERVDSLSYNPRENGLADVRFVEIITWRVRPGQEQNFMKAGGIVIGAHKEAKTDAHFVTYRVMGGALNGTFLTLSTTKSMGEMNPDPAQRAAYVKAVGEKMTDLTKLTTESLTNSETNFYRIMPTMSAVPDEWNQGENRAFWSTQMPAPAPAAATTSAGLRQTTGRKRTRP